MNPLMPIGMGTSMVGGIATGFGEAQGANAMAGEAERQAAQEMAAIRAQQKLYGNEIQNIGADVQRDRVTPLLQTQMNAGAGLGAYGKSLGINPAAMARTRMGLMRRGAVNADANAVQQQGMDRGSRQAQMGADVHGIQADQEMRRAGYAGAMQQAGQHGYWLRQAGNFLQAAGGPMTAIGMMSSYPEPAAEAAPTIPESDPANPAWNQRMYAEQMRQAGGMGGGY